MDESAKEVPLTLETKEVGCPNSNIDSMEPLPLPSHIHYELLLQLLERQTLAASFPTPALREQTQQLIITLRKALAQQKQIEAMCQQSNYPIEYRWSLNPSPKPTPSDSVSSSPSLSK